MTSDTTLETQALFYDCGIRTSNVTSVSDSSCASRFSSCWNSNTSDWEIVLLASPTAALNHFQMIFPPSSKHGGTHRSQTCPGSLLFSFCIFAPVLEGSPKCRGDITVTHLKHNLGRMLGSTCIGWRSILMLQGSGYDEALPDIQFRFQPPRSQSDLRQ